MKPRDLLDLILLAAIWGAGNTLLPIAAGPAHGSALQERIIAVTLRTGGASLIAVAILILWGLRGLPRLEEASTTDQQQGGPATGSG